MEAKAHIAEIETGLLRLEEEEVDDDTINRIFRAAHSIKGTASFFGLNKIVEVSHSIENLFGELREHNLQVNSKMIDVLLEATDILKELVNSPQNNENYDVTKHILTIKSFLDVSHLRPTQQASQTYTSSAWDLWNQLTSTNEKIIEKPIATIQEMSSELRMPRNSGNMNTKVELPVLQEQAFVKSGSKYPDVIMEDSVRVNVGLLNDLLNLAGEMVLKRNQLLRIAEDAAIQFPQLEVVAKNIDDLTTNLQKKVMKTRMQPIANIFNKFPRIVRDLSRKVGKEVDLVMQGTNVELDRSLIEALVDPMTHLVRNSLDHGIELPKIREMNNKPLTGSLVLRAYHESGRVIIEVCDDGAGIDLEKVKAKAIQKGIAGEKEISAMCEADIINFIMNPGFSTTDEITDISGRGVGMDVVKTNIEKIGGKIEIISEQSTGTTCRLIVPLTLEIISSLIVTANKQSFAIPQNNVSELLLIQPDEANGKRIEMVHNRPVLLLRGRLLPIVRLAALLMNTENLTVPKTTIDYSINTDEIQRVLVVKAGKIAYGLVVDSVYDTEEILVKPISTALGNSSLYSGVTVLGDGRIAMILDTESILAYSGLSFLQEQSLPTEAQAPKTINEEQQYLLLFKCSGDEMLGLDLAMVSRIVELNSSQLKKIGSKYFFSFQGQTIRVIRPEHYVPISRKKNKPSKIYIIMPKLVKHSIGIIAEKIHDAIYTTVSLDKDGVCGKGIFASALIDDKVVILLNLLELFFEAAPEYYNRSFSRRRSGEIVHFDTNLEEKKNTVLLVEDTPFFLKVVKSYLEGDGYHVITAENGREALEKLMKIKVDVVVSDIEMPLMTGIELVRAIRTNKALQHLPVIALTSITGESNKEKGLRAGFNVYEYKLDRIRLLESLRNVLNKHDEP